MSTIIRFSASYFVQAGNCDLHYPLRQTATSSVFMQIWARILPKRESFYFDALLPELAYPKFYNGSIREPADY